MAIKGKDIVFSSKSKDNSEPIAVLTDDIKNSLYENLKKSEEEETKPYKSAILAFIPKYASSYIPRHVTLNIPKSLPVLLYDAKRLKSPLEELIEESKELLRNYTITEEQVTLIYLSWDSIQWLNKSFCNELHIILRA